MSRIPVDGHWQLRFDFAGEGRPNDQPSVAVTIGAEALPNSASRLYTHEPPAPLPGEYRETPLKPRRRVQPRTRSVLPVPTPLSGAVEAGHFGHDETGRPIKPTRQEVREITASHADTLRDHWRDHENEAVEQGITTYAESFGTEAGERLRAHVRHLARESVAGGRGR